MTINHQLKLRGFIAIVFWQLCAKFYRLQYFSTPLDLTRTWLHFQENKLYIII